MRGRVGIEVALLAALAAAGPAAADGTEQPAGARLQIVVEGCFDRWLELHPLTATGIGDDRFNHRFDDGISVAYRERLAALARGCLEEVASVDRAALGAEDRLTYDLFVQEQDLILADLAFPDHLLQVSFFLSSPPFVFARMAGEGGQPFRTVEDYDDFLARMEAYAAWVDAAIAAMREGIAGGVVHARVAVAPALAQLEGMMAKNPRRTPFWSPIERMPAEIPAADRERIEAAFAATISGRVAPATAKLQAFLRDTYLPAARESVSWSALPGGKAWYAYKVRRYTTTSEPPERILATGVAEAQRLIRELETEARGLGFADGLAGLFTDLATNPSRRLVGEKRVLRRYGEIRARVEPNLPRLFSRLPAAALAIEPVPEFMAASAPGAFYVAPRPGAEGRGTFFVNVFADGVRVPGMEALFLHEAVPGHHFQGALAREIEGLPRFRRYAYQGAFIEGWALYAETLGGELGLYEDRWQRVGRLLSELLRAARLVLDVGIHHAGWSEAQAREIANTRLLGFGAAEIPRYAAEPAQALTYKVGQLAISRLRTEAEAALGRRFDVRAFHDEVLRHGPLPLDVLEGLVRAWIGEQSRETPDGG